MWWQIYLAIHAVMGSLAFGMYRNWLRQVIAKECAEAGLRISQLQKMYRRYDGWDALTCIMLLLMGPIGLLVAFINSGGREFRRGFLFGKMPDQLCK